MTSGQVRNDLSKFDQSVTDYIDYIKDYRLNKIIKARNNINGRENRQNLGCLYDFLEQSTNLLAKDMNECEGKMATVKSEVFVLAMNRIKILQQEEKEARLKALEEKSGLDG